MNYRTYSNLRLTPRAVAGAYAEFWVEGEEIAFEDAVDVTIGEVEAVRVDFVTPLNEGYVLVLEMDGWRFVVVLTAALGESGDHDELVAVLVESLAYVPVEKETE